MMIISRSGPPGVTFWHFRDGLEIIHKKLHAYEGGCDVSFGGDANPDNVFSGEITHFHGYFH